MKIPVELRDRKVYVVYNDALVENPKIVSFINRTLKQLTEKQLKNFLAKKGRKVEVAYA